MGEEDERGWSGDTMQSVDVSNLQVNGRRWRRTTVSLSAVLSVRPSVLAGC